MIARRNGTLLHISSLPSPHGIGDLGPEAYRFADFLHEAGQSLWQVLPLNPTSTVYGNSPYSSFSAFAGNPLFISLDRLVEDGFLTADDVKSVPSFSAERVDFEAVTAYKLLCLQKAAASYRGAGQDKDPGFRSFCSANAWWLDALYSFHGLERALRRRAMVRVARGIEGPGGGRRCGDEERGLRTRSFRRCSSSTRFPGNGMSSRTTVTGRASKSWATYPST